MTVYGEYRTKEFSMDRTGGRIMAWWNVTREGPSGLPTMLTQTVVAAAALCIGEIVSAPIYVGMASNRLALVPWAMVACLLAVAFVYTVGFAVLWGVDNLTRRMSIRYRPVAYGVVGMIGFGCWGRFVVAAFLDSLLRPLGLTTLSAGSLLLITINSAVLGFAAWFLAYVSPKPLADRRVTVAVIGVVTVLLAVAGAYYLSRMYAVLY